MVIFTDQVKNIFLFAKANCFRTPVLFYHVSEYFSTCSVELTATRFSSCEHY